MTITDVRIKLTSENERQPLLAYASITIDGLFVIHDVRIVRAGGRTIVAMPCNRATARCPHCNAKNTVDSAFCQKCGEEVHHEAITTRHDIAHPINAEGRRILDEAVLGAYRRLITHAA